MDGARKRRDALAGLTLGAVLGDEKELTLPTRPQVNRTLLDIIREEEPNSRAYKNLVDHHHNKKSWKSFKDRLRLKKAGAVWTNSVPASDVPLNRSAIGSSTSGLSSGGIGFGHLSRHDSVRVAERDVEEEEEVVVDESGFEEVARAERETGQVHLLNRSLSRVVSLQTDLSQEDTLHIERVPVSDVPVMNCRSSMLRRNFSRIPSAGQPDEGAKSMRLSEALAAEREQIQRVVSSTETAGRARVVTLEEEEREAELGDVDEEREELVVGGGDGQQPEVRMSLMDLLGETDGQMGWSPYSGDEDEEDEEDDEDAEEEEEGSNLVERNCCVCMVRHKGSAFIPCGHTFCRLCSRELWVSRGNCPLCNGFILEILDIF